MDLNVLLSSQWVIFLVVLIAVVIAIIFLTSFERKLNRKIVGIISGKRFFEDKLKELKTKSGNPQSFLVALDALARDFFSLKFGANRDAKYSELISFFKERKNVGAAEFCERMQNELYAGECLSSENLDFLFDNLEFLFREEEKINRLGEIAHKKMMHEQEEKKVRETERKNVGDAGVNKGVVKYLAEGLRRGFSLNLLKKKLLENNFSEQEINAAVEHLNLHLEEKPNEVIETPSFEEKKTARTKTYDKEPESHKQIRSLDDKSRIKERLLAKGRLGEGGLD